MNAALPKRFGESLKRLRKAKGLTQDALAERSGLTSPYISEVESGKANPTLISVEKLALGLSVETCVLFTFAHAEATPTEVRKRLKDLVDAADDQGICFFYDALLKIFT